MLHAKGAKKDWGKYYPVHHSVVLLKLKGLLHGTQNLHINMTLPPALLQTPDSVCSVKCGRH